MKSMKKESQAFTADRQLSDQVVAAALLPSVSYTGAHGGEEPVSAALERATGALGWADEERGLFASVVPPGARVLIKPNFVLHENEGPWGMEPLVTHPSLIRAVVEAVLRAGPSEVTVGDAPLQGCDFDQLLKSTGLDVWASELMSREPRFKGIRDFRRTTCVFVDGVRVASEGLVSEDQFVLFDLGRDSLLEPISDDRGSFRVTCYDPRLMAKTHTSGRHQYLVARDVIEADVVINLPKLKTHKKAGVTCALKNLIGINGNKEYLPHHRVGGSQTGGDCYPGGSLVKRALEYTLDRQNQTSSFAFGKLWNTASTQLHRVSHMMGDRHDVEGAWSGNDTIWRTCLDLNRILLYGRPDRTLADAPQRRVIHVVDAVVAGQGDGPLRPMPLPLGLILVGGNAAAIDWIGAELLGYNAERIPIAREAFGKFPHPLTSFAPSAISMAGDLGSGGVAEVLKHMSMPEPIVYPIGWRDAVRQPSDG
jgi:uncharacterized protein (DUF362 family)